MCIMAIENLPINCEEKEITTASALRSIQNWTVQGKPYGHLLLLHFIDKILLIVYLLAKLSGYLTHLLNMTFYWLIAK